MPWEIKNQMNQRSEFALRAMKTDNFRELCREYGISARTGYKWKARFEQEGLAGMAERSRRPRSSPEGLREEEVCRIVLLKERHRHWGARKIQALYGRQWGKAPCESSIKRVLARAGLVEKKRQRAARECGRICSGTQACAPNEVWTVDFKGWWRDAQGRCEPLTVRDEFSRMVLENRALGDAKTATVRAAFERLFEKHGLPGAIRSDNGTPFAASGALLGLSRLSAWWLALGIGLERSRPGCPQDNPGHERMHKDIAREIQGTAYEGRQATLDEWTREFNEERPHESLGMKTPAEVYQKSSRPWKGTPEQLEYEGMSKRRVQRGGSIRFEGMSYFLSTALGGWEVGLKAAGADKVDVYFGRLLLGQIEPVSASFHPVSSQEPRPSEPHGRTSAEPAAAHPRTAGTPLRASEFAAGCAPGWGVPAGAGTPHPCAPPTANSESPPATIDASTTTMKH